MIFRYISVNLTLICSQTIPQRRHSDQLSLQGHLCGTFLANSWLKEGWRDRDRKRMRRWEEVTREIVGKLWDFATSQPPPPTGSPSYQLHVSAVMRQPEPPRPLKTTINMYEQAGPDETAVKLRGANWLSGIREQLPASERTNTHSHTQCHRR